MTTVKILLGKVETAWKLKIKGLIEENRQLHIVGEVEEPVDTLLQVKMTNPDVIVLSQDHDGGEPGICSHLLLEYPNVVIVLVPTSGGPKILSRMALWREESDDSRDALRKMLRKLDAR